MNRAKVPPNSTPFSTMKFKDLRLNFKGLSLRNLLKGADDVKKPSWMVPISHGYYLVEDRSLDELGSNGMHQADTLVVQREEMGNLEMWFCSLSDSGIGDSISCYLQSHLFGKELKEVGDDLIIIYCNRRMTDMFNHRHLIENVERLFPDDLWPPLGRGIIDAILDTMIKNQIRGKSKEAMKKAYLSAKAKVETGVSDKAASVGSASVIVVSGATLVMAQMGGYRAILCRDGIAHQLRARYQYRGKKHWPHRLISGAIRVPKVRVQACHSRRESSRKQNDSTELIAVTEKVDSDTEFLILASTGIFQVMRNQEAVDLIRHIDDPQEAAECLSREALTRMSRSHISCVVIRFD